jgi:tripartite-type tricarboxylate transporter receptor subunit TctC
MMRFALALAFSCALAGAVQAQDQSADARWPERSIRFLAPFPAGSVTDLAVRAVTQKLSERLGQAIVIENRVGGSGSLASETIARAAPDGYTMGYATSSTHVIAAAVNPKLSYDPLKDFTQVSLIGIAPYVLVTYAGLPVHTVADLIALAKSKPHVLTYSSVGPASLAHMAGEMFQSMAGVELTHVPYRSASHAVIDLNEGRIDSQFGALGASLPFIRSGKLRALAVTTERRVDDLPDVPTMEEAGLAGYEASLWISIVMPAATPPAIVNRLNREIQAILAEPEIKKSFATLAVVAQGSTPEAMRERVRTGIETWRALVLKAGIKVQ